MASWALESIVSELAGELKEAGIEMNLKANVMLRPDVAIRLPRGMTTDQYRKYFKNEIVKAKELKAAALQARQVSLL